MKKLIKINGIDCLNCKFKLEDSLNAIDGVEAEVDLDKEIATVTMEKNVSDDQIIKVIEKAGYTGILL